MEEYILINQSAIVEKACNFAILKHNGQKRKYPEDVDYITHPLAVGSLLKRLNEPENLIVAGILHDTLEDTETTEYELKETFGKEITKLIIELTINKEEKRKVGKRKYLSNSVNNMSESAFTIKLCDRYHNIVTLDTPDCPEGFLVWYWKETKYIIDRLNRNFTKKQIVIINMINALLDYYKIIYNVNGPVTMD